MNVCALCGKPWQGHGTACNPMPVEQRGFYQFTPYQPTEDDIRRIVREELERAKERGG